MSRYACTECGSTLDIQDVGGAMTTAPLAFCPYCSTPSLVPTKSAFDCVTYAADKLNAPASLVRVFYIDWRKDPRGYVRFVSYVDALISGVLELPEPAPSVTRGEGA